LANPALAPDRRVLADPALAAHGAFLVEPALGAEAALALVVAVALAIGRRGVTGRRGVAAIGRGRRSHHAAASADIGAARPADGAIVGDLAPARLASHHVD